MRRLWIASSLALMLIVGMAGTALAKNDKGCTNSFHAVSLNTSYDGNGAPAPGVDAWWDMTLEGIEADGISMADLFAIFGVADIDAFYELVLDGVLPVDVNGNGTICAKAFPQQQNGTPLYYFMATDDKAG